MRSVSLLFLWLFTAEGLLNVISLQQITQYQIENDGGIRPEQINIFTIVCQNGDTENLSTDVSNSVTGNGTLAVNGTQVTDVRVICGAPTYTYTTELVTWVPLESAVRKVKRAQTSGVEFIDKSVLNERQLIFDQGGSSIGLRRRDVNDVHEKRRIRRRPKKRSKWPKSLNISREQIAQNVTIMTRSQWKELIGEGERRRIVTSTVLGKNYATADCPWSEFDDPCLDPNCQAEWAKAASQGGGVALDVARGFANFLTFGAADPAFDYVQPIGLNACIDKSLVTDANPKCVEDLQQRGKSLGEIQRFCGNYNECAQQLRGQGLDGTIERCLYELISVQRGFQAQFNALRDATANALEQQLELTLAVIDRISLLEEELDLIDGRILLLEANQDLIRDDITNLAKIVNQARVGIQTNALNTQINEFNQFQSEQTNERNFQNVANQIGRVNDNIRAVQRNLLGTIQDLTTQVASQTELQIKQVYYNLFTSIVIVQSDIEELAMDTNIRLADLTQQIEGVLQQQQAQDARIYGELERHTNILNNMYEAFIDLVSFTTTTGLTVSDYHRSLQYVDDIGHIPFTADRGIEPINIYEWEILNRRTIVADEFIFFNINSTAGPTEDGCDLLLTSGNIFNQVDQRYKEEAIATFQVPIIADQNFLHYGDRVTLQFGNGFVFTPNCDLSVLTNCPVCTGIGAQEMCGSAVSASAVDFILIPASIYMPGNSSIPTQRGVQLGERVVIADPSAVKVLHIQNPELAGASMCYSFANDISTFSSSDQYEWIVTNETISDPSFLWIRNFQQFTLRPVISSVVNGISLDNTGNPLGECILFDNQDPLTEDYISADNDLPRTMRKREEPKAWADGSEPMYLTDEQLKKREEELLEKWASAYQPIVERKRTTYRKRQTNLESKALNDTECMFSQSEMDSFLSSNSLSFTELYGSTVDDIDENVKDLFTEACNAKNEGCMMVVGSSSDFVKINGENFGRGVHNLYDQLVYESDPDVVLTQPSGDRNVFNGLSVDPEANVIIPNTEVNDATAVTSWIWSETNLNIQVPMGMRATIETTFLIWVFRTGSSAPGPRAAYSLPDIVLKPGQDFSMGAVYEPFFNYDIKGTFPRIPDVEDVYLAGGSYQQFDGQLEGSSIRTKFQIRVEKDPDFPINYQMTCIPEVRRLSSGEIENTVRSKCGLFSNGSPAEMNMCSNRRTAPGEEHFCKGFRLLYNFAGTFRRGCAPNPCMSTIEYALDEIVSPFPNVHGNDPSFYTTTFQDISTRPVNPTQGATLLTAYPAQTLITNRGFESSEFQLAECRPSCPTVDQRIECQETYSDSCGWSFNHDSRTQACRTLVNVDAVNATIDYTDQEQTGSCFSASYQDERTCVEGRLSENFVSGNTTLFSDVVQDRYACTYNRANDECVFWDSTFSNLITEVTPCFHRFNMAETIAACVPGFDNILYSINSSSIFLDHCFYIQDTSVKGSPRCLYNDFSSTFSELNIPELNYWNGEGYQAAYARCFEPGVRCHFGPLTKTTEVYQSEVFIDAFRPEITNINTFCAQYNTDFEGCLTKTYDPNDVGERLCEYLADTCSPKCSSANGDGIGCVNIPPFGKCMYVTNIDVCTDNTLEENLLSLCSDKNCATARERCNLFDNQVDCTSPDANDECTWILYNDTTPAECERKIRAISIPACSDGLGNVFDVCVADDRGTIAGATIELQQDCIILEATVQECVTAVDRLSGLNCVYVVLGNGNTQSSGCYRPGDATINSLEQNYGATLGVEIITFDDFFNVPAVTSTIYEDTTLKTLEDTILRVPFQGLTTANFRASGLRLLPDRPDALWQYPCTSVGYVSVGDLCCPPGDVITINEPKTGRDVQVCNSVASNITETSFDNLFTPQNMYTSTARQICNSNTPDVIFATPRRIEFPIFYMCRERPDVENGETPDPEFCDQFGSGENITRSEVGLYSCYPFVEMKVCEELQICERMPDNGCKITVVVDDETDREITMVRLTERNIKSLADILNLVIYNNTQYEVTDLFLVESFLGTQEVDVTENNITSTIFDYLPRLFANDMDITIDTLTAFFGRDPRGWRGTPGRGVVHSRSNGEVLEDGSIKLKEDVLSYCHINPKFIPVYRPTNQRFSCNSRVELLDENGAIVETILDDNCIAFNPDDNALPSDQDLIIHHYELERGTMVSVPSAAIRVDGSIAVRTGYVGAVQTYSPTKMNITWRETVEREGEFPPEACSASAYTYIGYIDEEEFAATGENCCGVVTGLDFGSATIKDSLINRDMLLTFNITWLDSNLTLYEWWQDEFAQPGFDQDLFERFNRRIREVWLETGCSVEFSNHVDPIDFELEVPGDNSTIVVRDKLRIFWEEFKDGLDFFGDFDTSIAGLVLAYIEPIVQDNTNSQCTPCSGSLPNECRNHIVFRGRSEVNSALNGLLCRLCRRNRWTWDRDNIDPLTGTLVVEPLSGVVTVQTSYRVPFDVIFQNVLLSGCPLLPLDFRFSEIFPQATVDLTNPDANSNLVVNIQVFSDFCPSFDQVVIAPGQQVNRLIVLCQGPLVVNITSFDETTLCGTTGLVNYNFTESLQNTPGTLTVIEQAAQAALATSLPSLINDIIDLINNEATPISDNLNTINLTLQSTIFDLTDLERRFQEFQNSVFFNLTLVENGTINLGPLLIEVETIRRNLTNTFNRVVATETITTAIQNNINTLETNIQNDQAAQDAQIAQITMDQDAIEVLLDDNLVLINDEIEDVQEAIQAIRDLEYVIGGAPGIQGGFTALEERVNNQALEGSALAAAIAGIIFGLIGTGIGIAALTITLMRGKIGREKAIGNFTEVLNGRDVKQQGIRSSGKSSSVRTPNKREYSKIPTNDPGFDKTGVRSAFDDY